MKRQIKLGALSSLFLIPLTGSLSLTSCGIVTQWDWMTSTNNNTEINYCLLIGQNDHPDSIERTRYTRKALGTLDEEATKKVKNNANIAPPKRGYLPYDAGSPEKGGFVVNELEHMEQKSMAGAAWDPITANASASAWTAKHGSKITYFVSNNDSMAEGAQWAANWIKGMPIFGYDANSSTIKMIRSGYITGTVDQNPSTQCSAAMMILRIMLEDKDLYDQTHDPSQSNNFGSKEYNPIRDEYFYNDDGHIKEDEYNKRKYGYVSSYFITDHSTLAYDSERQILASSTGIAAIKAGRPGWIYDNIETYINQDTGEAKTPLELADQFTHIKGGQTSKKYSICQTYCNKAETFLISTLRPYFTEYANRLGLDLEVVEGDGTGEEVVLNQIQSKPNKFDAYLINMAKTTATLEYIDLLAQKACKHEKGESATVPSGGWEKFEDRLNTPLIFYNRQPQTDNGEVDKVSMNNPYFKYTYFIGVDAPVGGEVQGNMIADITRYWYHKSLKN